MIGPDLYAFRVLRRQYRACRRNKRTTLNALAFEIDAEAKLLELQQALRAHTYRPGLSICFVTDGPKPREVFAAPFRDRVVHHLLVASQERVFEPLFIHDSYACRKGKGTLAASDRLMQFLRRITANGRRPAWALKLDVASFFPSIHKETLFEIIHRRIKDPEILWLTRTILFHDPTTNYRFRSLDRCAARPQTAGYPIPAQKSLFGKENERGLAPLGGCMDEPSLARSRVRAQGLGDPRALAVAADRQSPPVPGPVCPARPPCWRRLPDLLPRRAVRRVLRAPAPEGGGGPGSQTRLPSPSGLRARGGIPVTPGHRLQAPGTPSRVAGRGGPTGAVGVQAGVPAADSRCGSPASPWTP